MKGSPISASLSIQKRWKVKGKIRKKKNQVPHASFPSALFPANYTLSKPISYFSINIRLRITIRLKRFHDIAKALRFIYKKIICNPSYCWNKVSPSETESIPQRHQKFLSVKPRVSKHETWNQSNKIHEVLSWSYKQKTDYFAYPSPLTHWLSAGERWMVKDSKFSRY